MSNAFECDVCGNSDYIVDNGYYICNVCGTRILKNEYRKLRRARTSSIIRNIKLVLCLYLLCIAINRIIFHCYATLYYGVLEASFVDYVIAFNIGVICPVIIVLWYMFSSRMGIIVPRGRILAMILYALVSLVGTNKIIDLLLTGNIYYMSNLFFAILNIAVFAIVLFVNDIKLQKK